MPVTTGTAITADDNAPEPDPSRAGDHVTAFADLMTAPMSAGLWQCSDYALDAYLDDELAWRLCLDIVEIRVLAEQVRRRIAATGLARHTAINRVGDGLAHHRGLTTAQARRRVWFAAAIDERPATLAAYAAGALSRPQATKILTLIASIPNRPTTDTTDTDTDTDTDDSTDTGTAAAETADRCEAVLLDAAHAPRGVGGAFGRAYTKLADALDPDGPKPSDDPTRNELTLSPLLSGRYRLRGDLDAGSAENLLTALSPLSAPRPEDDGTRDRRGAAQRRADGLTEIIRRYLAGTGPDGSAPGSGAADGGVSGGGVSGTSTAGGGSANGTHGCPGGSGGSGGRTAAPADTSGSASGSGNTVDTSSAGNDEGASDSADGRGPRSTSPDGTGDPRTGTAGSGATDPPPPPPGGYARPQVHVHIRASDLAAAPEPAAARRLLDTGRIAELFAAVGAGWADHTGTITARTARTLACDAAITPIVTDDAGVPLNLGRTMRLATRAQRRALAARDTGCAFPGCTRPVAWTIAHHIIHWAHGGHTDLDNLVLLCQAHHHAVHDDGWTITMNTCRRPIFQAPARIDPFRRWVDTNGLPTDPAPETTNREARAG